MNLDGWMRDPLGQLWGWDAPAWSRTGRAAGKSRLAAHRGQRERAIARRRARRRAGRRG